MGNNKTHNPGANLSKSTYDFDFALIYGMEKYNQSEPAFKRRSQRNRKLRFAQNKPASDVHRRTIAAGASPGHGHVG
jgi:hypothetical protein